MTQTLNLDQLIGATYVTKEFGALNDCTLLDCICRIETLGKNMPADMVMVFRAEAYVRGLVAEIVFASEPEAKVATVRVTERVNTPQNTVDGNGYANMHGYTDVTPYEIVRVVSEKCIEVRRMTALKDPTFVPTFHAGGFAAHCSNQNMQTWLYESDDSAPVIKARLRKDGKYHSAYGQHRIAAAPRQFYDYNF